MTDARGTTHYEGPVITVPSDASLHEVADRMDQYAVGCVVVTEETNAPLGIVTDRDRMRRVVAPGRDPESLKVADVMTADPVTGEAEESLERLLDRMKSCRVRRLPIVSEERVVGLVTIDDIIAELGRELEDVREALRGEVLGARRAAPRRRRHEELETAIEEITGRMGEIGVTSRDWLRRELDTVRRRLLGNGF